MRGIAEEQVVSQVLRRTTSLFAGDVVANEEAVAGAVRDKRILIAGAAGSIGSAFVKRLVRFRPASLILIDLDENGLVELVRDLRSGRVDVTAELETLAIGL